MKRKWAGGLFVLTGLFLALGEDCRAEITGDEAFSDLTWEQVYEDQIQWPSGIVQSICATEDYIICIENTADSPSDPDIVSAYYKNDVDENGDPVERYSLAKRTADTNWEHGNGMTYNPNTHEIYVALYTNLIPENRGCLYVMNPDTLAYERKIKVSDDYNILGIDYVEESDQYVIQTDADGGFRFQILDADFQVVEDLGSYGETAKGNNFQDLVVDGDYIINFPLTLGLGIGDYLHVYSISRKEMVADPKIDFNFEDVVWDEPESLCEIEPGVYLAAVNVEETDGSRKVQFYKTEIPYYFQVSTALENKEIVKEKVLRGEDYTVECPEKEGYALAEIMVNGENQLSEETGDSLTYTIEDVQKDYTIELNYKKNFLLSLLSKIKERIWTDRSAAVAAAVLAASIFIVAAGGYGYYAHVKMERRRKRIRARRYRQVMAD